MPWTRRATVLPARIPGTQGRARGTRATRQGDLRRLRGATRLLRLRDDDSRAARNLGRPHRGGAPDDPHAGRRLAPGAERAGSACQRATGPSTRSSPRRRVMPSASRRLSNGSTYLRVDCRMSRASATGRVSRSRGGGAGEGGASLGRAGGNQAAAGPQGAPFTTRGTGGGAPDAEVGGRR